ncbi:SMP-30/gluconolactonase/LRE family protein [Microbulbifer rhizosphaerae]|uniref:Sugar lactone lactonase YvrE n=1 Tax=Microbulbifer rhizosphaerae TaxID=1562603 RepID=A0A7W4WDT8_9GAMM|nr:sugar lactone lactonase YvrE [Microbulbifer rhizosphaerae]
MQQLQMEPECVWPAAATLGEGPVWVAREQALYWVDIKRSVLHRYCPPENSKGCNERSSWQLDSQLSAIAPRAGGGFVGAIRDGFALLFPDGDGVGIEPLGGPESDIPGNRFNDGKVDAAGRFWAGSMDDGEEEPTGALYRLDPDLSWQRLDADYVITNGPTFSPDNRILYHTDTLKRTVYAFDLETDGSPRNKQVFLQLPEESGYPDGMTVDAEGCLWVCHWGGWGVTRFSPEGEAIGRIELPVANVTSCTFAGPDLDTLYITTARKGLSDAELADQPLAGGLFRCRPGVRGPAPVLFGG